jgi:hypothetical protein
MEKALTMAPVYYLPILSFDQLNKRKKPGTAVAAVPQKPMLSPKNVPDKPPGQAPHTSLQDMKKVIRSDTKTTMKPQDSVKEKPVAPKAAHQTGKSIHDIKENSTSHEALHLANQKQSRKGKAIEEN